MSVLIKGVEMPNNCGECQFCHTESFAQWCCPTGREDVSYDSVPQWCPLDDPVKWTPVTEGLPEESDGTVLVCMPNKSPYNQKEPFVNAKHNRQVETATYSQYSDTWHFKNGGVTSARPIAWMPLPTPWRGEEDE